MRVTTEAGSVYEFDGQRMKRKSDSTLRRDGEWIQLLVPVEPRIGEPMWLPLEPLGDGEVTVRMTTPVVSIEP